MSTIDRPRTTDDALRQAQRAVIRRLDRLRGGLRTHLFVEGLFWVGGALLAALAISLLLDRMIRFEPATRWALGALLLAGVLAVAYRKLWLPLRLPLAHLDLAQLLDRRVPGVGQQIANVLELPELLANTGDASPAMVRAAVLECVQSLDRRDLSLALNHARRRKLLAACGLGLGLLLGFCVLAPQTARIWALRWLTGSELRWPQHNYLSIEGLTEEGTLLVPRGELTLVQVNSQPKFTEEFPGRWSVAGRGRSLVVEANTAPQPAPPEQVSLVYTTAAGDTRRGNAEQFDATHFRYELAPLADPAELTISGGDDWLDPIRVVPIDRPTVTTLEITAERPGNSPQTERVGQGTSQLLYLPETKLSLKLIADQSLSSAEVLDKGAPLSGWSRQSDTTYTLAWTMKEPLALEFRLRGQRGALVSKPYFLAIGLLKDREPRVTIRSSGVGRRVTPVARIPLSVRANDDFGLASLVLDWELTTVREEKPTVETMQQSLEANGAEGQGSAPRTETVYDNELELREAKLTPGQSLKLRAAAADACALGAQTGHSRWLSFQVVSADELFYEILMRQREQRAKFAASLESMRTQEKSLAALAKTDDLPGLARAQQVINRQVWQVTGQLSATLEEMTLNELGNPQARDSLQRQVIEPLGKLHEDLLARLRAGFDTLSPEGQTIAEAKREESLTLARTSITTMESILAQMSLWESFVDVINQLKHVIDQQGSVLKATEEIEKKRTDDLFD